MPKQRMTDKKAAAFANIAQDLILPLASNVVRDHGFHAEDMPFILTSALIIALQKLRTVRKENAEQLAQDCVNSLSLSLQKTGFPIVPPDASGQVGSAVMREATPLLMPH